MNLEEIFQNVVALSVGALGLSFVIQKFLNNWKESSVDNSLRTTMHKELKRMSEQNLSLIEEVAKLHTDIIGLYNVISKLTIENENLKQEVSSLMETNEKLSKEINTLDGAVGALQEMLNMEMPDAED